jgi:hypothetical protein
MKDSAKYVKIFEWSEEDRSCQAFFFTHNCAFRDGDYLEYDACLDEWEQLGGIKPTPRALRCVQQFESHGQAGSARANALARAGPQLHRGEGRPTRACRPNSGYSARGDSSE